MAGVQGDRRLPPDGPRAAGLRLARHRDAKRRLQAPWVGRTVNLAKSPAAPPFKAGCWDGCECLAPTSSFSTSLIRGVCADAQTGSDYALKSGAQVSVVRNVIRGVAGV